MAGLIARLLGGTPRPGPAEPAPGIGGYTAGPGPAGQTGFPGSTAQTRTLRGRSPRDVKVGAATDTGTNNALGTALQVRQASYRGDLPGAARRGPRATSRVPTPQPAATQELQQNSAAEFYGGPMLRTGPGNLTAGGQPLAAAQAAGGHSVLDTATAYSRAQVEIGGGTPGGQNVRNDFALKYKSPPGAVRAYQSAARADQAPVNPGGQATDGNVHPGRVTELVTVPSRYNHDGFTSWQVLREMPYGGRGNGARGADLNGQRYYAAGQGDQFWNGGQGGYGIARQRGSQVKRPVSFTQPAPWTANFYDTTASVGADGDQNTAPAQQPQAVYYSPGGMRASNSTGRTG